MLISIPMVALQLNQVVAGSGLVLTDELMYVQHKICC